MLGISSYYRTMIIFLIVYGLLMILMLSYIFMKVKKAKERILSIFDGVSISPEDFLKLRNISYGGRGGGKLINQYNVPGVYVAINYSRKLFYIGQGQQVFDRIFHLFTGKGNMEVYSDYNRGDNFKVLAFQYNRDHYNNLSDFKEHLSSKFERELNKYGQKNKTKIQAKLKYSNELNQSIDETKKSGVSVTRRIKSIKQPYGGYLKASHFKKHHFDDGIELYDKENLHGLIIGLAVDYLTRVTLGEEPSLAFKASLLGAQNVGKINEALELVEQTQGLEDKVIISACQLSSFDVAYRRGPSFYTKDYLEINPDLDTIRNIRTMVKRTVKYLEDNGPILKVGFDLEGAYTNIIAAGDGDFLTKNAVLDLKVLKYNPNKDHTLQLLIYYLMGLRSNHEEFKEMEYLGIFNPRKNIAYEYKISDIDSEIIKIVEKEVIGYP